MLLPGVCVSGTVFRVRLPVALAPGNPKRPGKVLGFRRRLGASVSSFRQSLPVFYRLARCGFSSDCQTSRCRVESKWTRKHSLSVPSFLGPSVRRSRCPALHVLRVTCPGGLVVERSKRKGWSKREQFASRDRSARGQNPFGRRCSGSEGKDPGLANWKG